MRNKAIEDRLSKTLFFVVFMWFGIHIALSTVEDLPPEEWTWAAAKAGLTITAVIVAVTVADEMIRWWLASRRAADSEREAQQG